MRYLLNGLLTKIVIMLCTLLLMGFNTLQKEPLRMEKFQKEEQIKKSEKEDLAKESHEKEKRIKSITEFFDDVKVTVSIGTAGGKRELRERMLYRINDMPQGVPLPNDSMIVKMFYQGAMKSMNVSWVPRLKGSLLEPVLELELKAGNAQHRVLLLKGTNSRKVRKVREYSLTFDWVDLGGIQVKGSGILKLACKKEMFGTGAEVTLVLRRDWEQEKVFLSGLSNSRLRAIPMVNRFGMGFVWIPAGTFMMGGNIERNVKPIHRVTLTRGFYMQTTEVTISQWHEVMRGKRNNDKDGNHPLRLAWNQVQEFIERLNSKDIGHYRLPTEAEWEYTCRAGKTGYVSYEELRAMAWYYGNASGNTHPVAKKKPNPWGLYDMQGNAREFCSDLYDSDYYEYSPEIDPQGPSKGRHHVIRGGSWSSKTKNCRSWSRGSLHWLEVQSSDRLSGFRLVRTYP